MSAILVDTLEPKFREEICKKFTTLNDKLDFTNCLTCGMCTAGCPYSDIHENMDPRKFIRKVLVGMKEDVLTNEFIWNCTMCGRCTMECPMKVDIGGIVRTVRGNFGLRAPGFLQDIVEAQLHSGNQMEITEEDYLDTLEWMEEELQEEVDDENAKIPVDKEGADFLFLWDPREIKYYPSDVQSIGKIMYAAGANWTCSSKVWDATHYGLFTGDDEASKILMQRVADEVKRLKVKYLVVTECGHAFRAQKWGPKVWLNKEDASYPVYSILELMARWIKEGRIKLDKSKNTEEITYHDPCNASRKEGLIELPRYILSQAVEPKLKEMWPTKQYNYCCGGGGGSLGLGSDYKDNRLKKGKVKADQIENTGCKVCVTPCHNCYDQLNEIIRHYKLDVKLKHIHHLVSNALVLD
ncbi:Fe-S oxidoreductase [Desulfonispora thiosulfatigenes DSM 11270]|uniref:Fe-S oxidoreductase n=1 Tax=Desulfonispora thiosulfatigenes DSM 11270 TaxID=656914 RepID=A0A1W1VD26_DESTI|nr:(Fe-S)-binding protein [Desulfonispora thiosulfatigenes]SMB91278.1 Fe-S oxidoreductase [Desulfonispora thiosulfatigenes DSM 11270]